jgi:TPR repeat protein
MKKYYFLLAIVCLCANPVLAQDCYEKTRSKGISAYSNGKYEDAKKYFDFAKSCDDKPANNDLQAQINRCDEKIAEAKAADEKRRQDEAARKAREAEEQKARQEAERRKREAAAEERKRQEEQRRIQEVIPEPPINLNPPPKSQTTLSVSKNSISFDASGEQEFFIDITTDELNWAVSKKIDWCRITQPTSKSVRLVCQVNTDDIPRSDSFYIIAGDMKIKIDIRQEAAKDPVALGNKFYREEKYEEARKLYLIAVVRGNAEAQYRLGKMYLEGNGVEKNRSTAMTFFKKSAAYQYSPGENAVGYMYETQNRPDYEEAAYWYMRSAQNGYAVAQYNLGLLYQYGLGVKKNEKEAQKWFQKSATQGFVKAENELEWQK